MEIPHNREITYFANTNYRDKQTMFGIKRRDRRQHMYVLGKSGTGKSAMLKNMIIQNITNGEGVAVVDPHGELAEEVLEMIPPERKNDVIYFNPADTDYYMGFNVLEVPDPKYKHLIASGLMGIFTKIWANVWSSRMEYILNNAILALLDTPGSTMLGIPRLLVDQDYRQSIIDNIQDPVVKSFWITEYESWQERFRNEAIAPIQNKVGQFLSSAVTRNIVGQSKSTINIFDIMNNKKILLVNVSKGRVGEDNSALLGAMLITKIQLAAMERVRIPEEERKDFYLYVDEFQNFVTDSFASILSEARKYRLNLILAHQYISQLVANDSTAVRDAVFGNVGTMAIFRVGAADAEYLEQEFEPEFTPQDFVNLPNYHIYTKLMIDGVTSRPFSAATLPPFRVSGSKGVAQEIIENSRALYAIPREDVEDEINSWSRSKPGVEDAPEADANIDKLKPGADGRYRVKCSLFEECGNIAEVPFKPEKGRPIYCKEHIEKIKSGEVKPIKAPTYKPNKRVQETMNALAGMGIGIGNNKQQNNNQKHRQGGKSERSKHPKKTKNQKPNKARHPADSSEQKKVDQKKNEKDSFALKDILQQALGTKKESTVLSTGQKTQTKENPKGISDTPKPSLSLADLGKKASQEQKETPKKNIDRAASDASLSGLKAALSKAKTGKEAAEQKEKPPMPPENEPDSEELEAQKKILEEQKQKAEARAEQAHREVEEERQKRLQAEQDSKEHAEKLLETERKRKELERGQQNQTPKEIPEDILQRVLE